MILWANSKTEIITVVGIIISLLGTLYWNSAFHKIHQSAKIKLASFKSRIKVDIMPEFKKLYLKYQHNNSFNKVHNSNTYNTFQQYLNWNNGLSCGYTYAIISYDIISSINELEFLSYLKKCQIISGWIVNSYRTINGGFGKVEYLLVPSIKSINKVEKEYHNSSDYKQQKLVDMQLLDALYPEQKQLRLFRTHIMGMKE